MTEIVEATARTPRKGERTKATIVAAAARLFTEQGYAGTAMSDILAATGLTKGAFYFHFTSKAELALAVIEVEGDRRVAWLKAQAQSDASATDQLVGIVQAMRRLVTAEPELWGVIRLGRELRGDPEIQSRLVAGMGRWLGLVERIVTDGQSSGEFTDELAPAAVASLIVGGFEGAKELTASLGEDEAAFATRLDSLVDLVLRALTAH